MPFALLYWNADATRMPAANHSFYLRQCYLDNTLSQGKMTIANVQLDLSRVKVPLYKLATRAGEMGLPRLKILRRPGALRAGRLRPHRRRRQPARQGQVPVLDQRQG